MSSSVSIDIALVDDDWQRLPPFGWGFDIGSITNYVFNPPPPVLPCTSTMRRRITMQANRDGIQRTDKSGVDS